MLDTPAEFQSKVYANERTFKGRITTDLSGSDVIYDDNTIIRMNILEETNVLNDEVSSNELNLTLDNSTGAFDFLTLANMNSIIGQKRYVKTELGVLVFDFKSGDNFLSDFAGKVFNSSTPNAHKAMRSGVTALNTPYQGLTELSQAAYDLISPLDGSITNGSVNTANYQMQAIFSYNLIFALESKYGPTIWDLQNPTQSDKIAKVKTILKSITAEVDGYGNAPANNTTRFAVYNIRTNLWENTDSTFLQSTTYLSATVTNLADYVDVNGLIHFTFYTDGKSNGTTAANLYLDYAAITLVFNDLQVAQWVSTGKFFISSFSNEVTDKIVNIVGHDHFDSWAEIMYTPMATANPYATDILLDIVNTTPIKIQDLFWSFGSLNYRIGNFPEPIDVRSALQKIAVATQTTVYQDRYGQVNVKDIGKLDAKTNFATFVSSQNGLYHYASSQTYSIETTSSGMRYMDYDVMYEPPKVSLEKSIYQINVKVYPSVGAEPTDNIFTNPAIVESGDSIVIDNPLINTVAIATDVANWYFANSAYNAVYEVHWRQNPMLEAKDIVTIEDSFGALKRSRIQKQELIYEGYLEGNTTSRGGL